MNPSPSPVRLGVLGTGTAASLTLGQLTECRAVSVEAIAGQSEESSRAAAARLGVPRWAPGLAALIADPAIEAVYIALPIGAHAHWAVQALRAGKHVLVEKPAAATAAELAEVAAAQRGSGKVFMEGMMVRHHPQWHFILDTIRSGMIGDVRAVQGTLTRVPPGADDPAQAFNRRDQGWSVVLDNGCYMVHLTRAAFSDEPQRISALGDVDERFGTLASASALMQFPKGTASFTISTRMRRQQRFSILGTLGRIEAMLPVMPIGGPAIVVVDGRDVTPPAPPTEHRFEGLQFRLQIEAFARAVRGLETPVVDIGNALGNMRALDAISLSTQRDGAWVAVDGTAA